MQRKQMNKYLQPKNYINFLINKIYILLLVFIKKWEQKYCDKYANMSLKYQPVFIIGAPRTGSTILYQIITNQLDVLYIDNLICRFNKSLFFGFWLSNKLFKQMAHNCFKSNHGDTSMCGLHAPSECGSFWYRWLPRDRHFIDFNDIDENMVEEIKKEVISVMNYANKPLVFKNLNMGQRLRLLYKCFPNAKFIFIKRDPVYTAQSILKAKRQLNMNDDDFWSVMPKNVKELKKMNSYEQIVKQIFYIEKQIKEDLKLFPKDQVLEIDYVQLGNNFQEIVDMCKRFIGVKERDDYERAVIRFSESISLSTEEIEILKMEIEKLDWNTYDL
jgi:hypothetical protein